MGSTGIVGRRADIRPRPLASTRVFDPFIRHAIQGDTVRVRRSDRTSRQALVPPPIPLAPGTPAEEYEPFGYGGPVAPDEWGRHGGDFVDRERGSRGRLVLAALLLVAGAVVATVVLTGGDDGADAAAPPGPGTSGAPGPGASDSVSPVTGELLAAYQPQQVTRQAVDGGIRVAWRAPARTDGIAGYLAIAQSPSGTYQKTAFPAANTMDAVLSGDPVTADSCVIVVTVIDGTPGMKVAPGGLVCATGGPRAPGSMPPSAATRKPESKP